MTDTHAHYLRDPGYLLREAGERAKKDAAPASAKDRRLVTGGRRRTSMCCR
jgi:hypothetical protein